MERVTNKRSSETDDDGSNYENLPNKRPKVNEMSNQDQMLGFMLEMAKAMGKLQESSILLQEPFYLGFDNATYSESKPSTIRQYSKQWRQKLFLSNTINFTLITVK